MSDAGVPQEFNVILEQFEHSVYLFMTAEYPDGFVVPRIEGVWSDGIGVFQVDLSYDHVDPGITSGRGQAVLVWTTLGNPTDGPWTIYIKEARSRTLLKVVNFTRTRFVPLASDANAMLYLQHQLGDVPFGMVPNDILPNARLYAPRTFNHIDTSTEFWPVYLAVRLHAETAISNVTVDLSSAVGGLTITPTTPQTRANMEAGEEFQVTFQLQGSGIAVGVHEIDYSVTYETPTGSLTGQFKMAVLNPGTVSSEALRVKVSGATIPWAYRAGNYTETICFSEPIRLLNNGATGSARAWSTDELAFPDLNIPPGDLGPITAVGAVEEASGPGPLAVSAGGVVVGGAASATYDIAVDGETSVKSVIKGAILGGLGADVGAAVKAAEYGAKGIKAAVGFFKKIFNCPHVFIEPGKAVIQDYVFESVTFIQTLDDDSQKAVKFYGRGDPMPGGPIGSNVISATSLPF